MLIASILVGCNGNTAKPVKFYVDMAQGDDKHTGKQSSPVATLYRAQELVRTAVKSTDKDIIVYLKGGVYTLSKTWTFDGALDSPADGKTVTYKAYNNEKVYISGGLRLDGWTVFDRDNGIVKATVPEGFYTRDLYVNDKPAIRARTAKIDTALLKWPDFGPEILYRDGGALARSPNPGDMEVVFNYQWYVHRAGVVSAEVRDGIYSVLTLKQKGHQRVMAAQISGIPYTTETIWYFENAFALLDEPGEWYFDRSAQTVYYKLRAGEQAGSLTAFAGLTEMLIDNRPESTLKNIIFEGLTFSHTTWLQPEQPEGWVTIQAGLYVTVPEDRADMSKWQRPHTAIRLVNTDGIQFVDNDFINLGNGVIDMERTKNARISGNLFTYCGGTALLLGGFDCQGDQHTRDEARITSDCEISNNYIHHICTNMQSTCGVTIGFSRNIMFTNNTLHDLPYTGLSYGWGWGCNQLELESESRGGRIANNHIYDVLQQVFDGGGIYTLSQRDGIVIENNYVHHVQDHFGAIYLDNSSAGYTVRNNVLHDNTRNLLLTSYDTNVYGNYLDDVESVMYIGFKDREGNMIRTMKGGDGKVYVLSFEEWASLNNTYSDATEDKKDEIIASSGVEPAYRARFGIE